MRTLAFNRPATITLDAQGNGVAQLGPVSPGEIWYPQSTQITTAGTASVSALATVTILTGPSPGAGVYVDSTYDWQGASSSIIAGQTLYPGNYVLAVWAGAAALAAATLIVAGTRTVP